MAEPKTPEEQVKRLKAAQATAAMMIATYRKNLIEFYGILDEMYFEDGKVSSDDIETLILEFEERFERESMIYIRSVTGGIEEKQ